MRTRGPKQLSDTLHARIKQLSECGDKFVADGAYNDGLQCYMDALQLLPDPVEDWEAATWLLAAIGEAYYVQHNYQSALEAFTDALTCPGGMGNPFIHLRLGETQYELQNLDRAKDELARAYMGGGKDIFAQEDLKYLDWLGNYLRTA